MKTQAITACAFIRFDGELLIAKRANSKKFLPGKWELLGGHIEFGETVEDGLRRELREELHVDVKIGCPFHVFTYLSENEGVHNVEIDYLAEIKDQDQKIRLNPEDHSEFKWISKNEIDEFFEGGDPEKTAIKNGFKLLDK